MSLRSLVSCCLLLTLHALLLHPSLLRANDGKQAEKKEAAAAQKETGRTSAAPSPCTTSLHRVKIGGKKLSYLATAGMMTLQEEEGKERAKIFYVAYTLASKDKTKEKHPDLSDRPVTFAFNGGPGSSAVWLHMGCLGPRRVALTKDGQALPPPARLVDNEYSLLDVTDLVFIDPVTTGYSRAASKDQAKKFHSIDGDIESVGQFIHLYATRNHRWASPKYLIGESYGTTRAAGLAAHLHHRYGMDLNGVVLVSAVLDFQTIRFTHGNDLPYVLFLPTYTATAWYHRLLPKKLQQLSLKKACAAARRFAEGPYATALAKGRRLRGDAYEQMVAELARFTGLSKGYLEASNLRVPLHRFTKELLRGKRKIIGRMDTRITAMSQDHVNDTPRHDPSLSTIMGPFTGALNHYLRDELEFESDLPYEILTHRVHPWNWGRYENKFVTMSDSLGSVFGPNPHFRVFVANGYYDGATPFFATEYTVDHLDLPAEQADNVTMRYYEGGHMMYSRLSSLRRLKEDLARWYGE